MPGGEYLLAFSRRCTSTSEMRSTSIFIGGRLSGILTSTVMPLQGGSRLLQGHVDSIANGMLMEMEFELVGVELGDFGGFSD